MPNLRVSTILSAAALSIVLLQPGSLAVTAQEVPPVRLLPHKATYTLTLDRSRPAGNLAAVDGKSEYVLEQTSCSWLRSVSSIVLNVRGTNGARTTLMSTVDIHEQLGGAEMQFKTSRLQDGKQVQASEGIARRANGRIAIRVRVPETREFEETDDVQFPIQQLSAVLQAAVSGRTQAGGRLYDGTDTATKLYRMTAQIGAQTSRRVLSRGPEQAAWPVAMGYFADTAAPSNFPEHELSATLLQDGVYTDVRFIFRDFALIGTMTGLTVIPSGNCD